VGVGRKTARKRAVGTREHIISYLTEVSELFDTNGMASTRLATAVGYPGSSVAFAQLLSGMERSGLIEREVRGKRTYRIRLGSATIAGPGGTARLSGTIQGAIPRAAGPGGIAAAGGIPAAGTAGFDYDELARRLLVQVVRRLGASGPEAGQPDRSELEPPSELERPPDLPRPPELQQPDRSELQETVTGLEYELATAWTKHGKLAEENVRLREQLSAAQRSLAQAAERVRKLPVSTGLDSSEVVLLQRLLTSAEAVDSSNGSNGSNAEPTSLAG
jgi:hypothetical protein